MNITRAAKNIEIQKLNGPLNANPHPKAANKIPTSRLNIKLYIIKLKSDALLDHNLIHLFPDFYEIYSFHWKIQSYGT